MASSTRRYIPDHVRCFARAAVRQLIEAHVLQGQSCCCTLAAIPSGGVAAAGYVCEALVSLGVEVRAVYAASSPASSLEMPSPVVVVDDIYDSGKTLAPFIAARLPTLVLVARDAVSATRAGLTAWGQDLAGGQGYVSFPWEASDAGPEDAVRRLLQFLGEDPDRSGLKDTPRRVLEWLSEFKASQPLPRVTAFDGIHYDQMVVVRDITFTSLCEHHLLPFSGTVSIAYIIEDKAEAIGLSKMARLVDWASRKLQVQERMTEVIKDAVAHATSSSSVAVVVAAEHMCMSLRGVKRPGHKTVTSALSGVFLTDPLTRSEFFQLCR